MKKKNILAVLVIVLSLSIGMVANADPISSDPFLNAQTDPNVSGSIWASNGVITLTDSKTNKQAVFDARDFQTVSDAVSELATKVDELNDSLTSLNADFVKNIYVGDDGKLHKVQGGADSVINFNRIAPILKIYHRIYFQGSPLYSYVYIWLDTSKFNKITYSGGSTPKMTGVSSLDVTTGTTITPTDNVYDVSNYDVVCVALEYYNSNGSYCNVSYTYGSFIGE